MRSHALPKLRPLKRHDLVYLDPARWDSVLERQLGSDRADPLIRSWVDREWPLVARRPMVHETHGIALGLPLPPSLEKRRIPFVVEADDILAIHEPTALACARGQAPMVWQRTFDELEFFAAHRGIELQVFGSVAWQALTGLAYLTSSSDIDLLLHVRSPADIDLLSSEISRIEDASPNRIDGEFIRDDGLAANWREFLFRPADVMVKSMKGIALLDRKRFLAGDFLS
jgi:phosphoribosyl-dephospho-CoA transferase